MSSELIRVFVADDHGVIRQGLQKILADTGDLCVCGEAVDVPDLLRRLSEQPCDVLVLDMNMPGGKGIETIKDLKVWWAVLEPHTTGYYANLEQDASRAQKNFGPNYDRLVAVKTQYDPGNLFRLNANIKPAA